jgi:hypothetical protein
VNIEALASLAALAARRECQLEYDTPRIKANGVEPLPKGYFVLEAVTEATKEATATIAELRGEAERQHKSRLACEAAVIVAAKQIEADRDQWRELAGELAGAAHCYLNGNYCDDGNECVNDCLETAKDVLTKALAKYEAAAKEMNEAR